MGIQMSTGHRTARAAASEAYIGASPTIEVRTGVQPANNAAGDTGTLLATFALPADWADQAAGVLTMKVMPLEIAAVGDGNAGHYRMKKTGGEVVYQGSVTATGAGGNLTVDNVVTAVGQILQITAWSITEGNA